MPPEVVAQLLVLLDQRRLERGGQRVALGQRPRRARTSISASATVIWASVVAELVGQLGAAGRPARPARRRAGTASSICSRTLSSTVVWWRFSGVLVVLQGLQLAGRGDRCRRRAWRCTSADLGLDAWPPRPRGASGCGPPRRAGSCTSVDAGVDRRQLAGQRRRAGRARAAWPDGARSCSSGGVVLLEHEELIERWHGCFLAATRPTHDMARSPRLCAPPTPAPITCPPWLIPVGSASASRSPVRPMPRRVGGPGPQGRGPRLLVAVHARPLRRSARPRPRPDGRGRRHHRAARRRPRVRQRLQAPGGAGQGDGHHRHPLRRPPRAGHRCGLDGHRLRAVRHPLRPPRGAGRPHGRGPGRDEGALRRRCLRLRGRALHHHRHGRAAQAADQAPPADPHRRRRAAGAGHRRPRGRHRGHQPQPEGGRGRPRRGRDATAEATDRKVGWVRDAAGDRFDDLELNCLMFACIPTDDRAGTRRDDVGPVRHHAGRDARGTPRAHGHGRRDVRRPRGPARPLGVLVLRGSSTTPWTPWPRSSPAWPAAERPLAWHHCLIRRIGPHHGGPRPGPAGRRGREGAGGRLA